jgi:hypothetical protein
MASSNVKSGAERGLFEQERDVAASQSGAKALRVPLQLMGEIQQCKQFILRDIEIAREVDCCDLGERFRRRHSLDRLQRRFDKRHGSSSFPALD